MLITSSTYGFCTDFLLGSCSKCNIVSKFCRLGAWFSDMRDPGQDQLVDVLQIGSTGYAFAALRRDGRVVTWGAHDYGGYPPASDEQI